MFELELSWVGAETNGVHKRVPDDVSLHFFENANYLLKKFSFLIKIMK